MSHKTNPMANRLPLTKRWSSTWYADHLLAFNIIEDEFIRRLIDKTYTKDAAIESVAIERSPQEVKIVIHTGKPGVVIGRGGKGVQTLRETLGRRLQSFRELNVRHYVRNRTDAVKSLPTSLKLDISEVKNVELHATLVGKNIAYQIENRMPYRRAVRQSIEKTMQRGAQGIRISISGRLNGADIARQEKYSEGTVPLSTLRNDIDYGQVDAKTASHGTIGVKVWIYRGDKLADVLKPQASRSL